MPTDNGSERPGQRRIVLRRSRRQGAQFSRRGRMDGTPRDIEPDDVDDAIDPELVDQHVRSLSRQPPTPPDSGDGPSPQQRLNEVAGLGDAEYFKEHRLTTMHRLLMRNIPLDQIARQLNISLSTAQKDRAKLKKRLREFAKDLNIDEMIGNQGLLYDEIGGMAMRIATKTTGDGAAPIPMQLAAMRTTLASQADKTRFYQSAGVFDVLRFRKADTGEAQSDIQLLMQQTRQMMASLMDESGMGDFERFDTSDLEPESEEL